MTVFSPVYEGNWVDVEGYLHYVVSDTGRVVNKKNGLERAVHQNQQGICTVTLMQDGARSTVSVAKLVAEHFLSREGVSDLFDTPTHKDGDKSNCDVGNLMWRPRWFAVAYHRQFQPDHQHIRKALSWAVYLPKTDEVFENSWDAAVKYGLLNMDIVVALSKDEQTFPYGWRFEYIKPKDRESFGLSPAVGYELLHEVDSNVL